MKKLAGQDFEDLLQCAIPVFERLLPEPHNNHIMKLLFRTAEWHGLAKLRMHTEVTLAQLEKVAMDLGHLMRDFRDVTSSNNQTSCRQTVVPESPSSVSMSQQECQQVLVLS